MSVHITYFVHGTTTDNEQGLATGWNPGVLSPLGLQQAEELRVIVEDKHFDAVFASDLKRAVEFSHLVFPTQKIMLDPRLREANYGVFNGRPDQFKADAVQFIQHPFPQGESYKDVEKRIGEFIQMLKEKHNGKKVAIVAHQAPQLALGSIASTLSMRGSS